MTELQKVYTLVDLVKQSDYYVPRNYQTLGGIWTTDTYERDGVKVQAMDEGYSTLVSAENLRIFIRWDAKNNKDYIVYEEGNSEIVESLLMKFSSNFDFIENGARTLDELPHQDFKDLLDAL